jgi:hypothetical protein
MIINQDSITLDAVLTNDDIPMWNSIQQSEAPTRVAEGGLLVYDAATQQYKRLPDASDPVPHPMIDSAAIAQLADILAKLIAAPATEAKQDMANTALSTIATNTGAGATELTAAAILAALADPATQTTLAAVLTKLSSDPATATLQTTGNSSLANLDIALTDLRDAIAGGTPKTLADIVAALGTLILAAGTNVIGKVGIDQTTPGTTNAVTPVNSSGTELMTETDPGATKIIDVGIIIPTDKQAIYRHAEIDYTTPITGSGTYTSSAIDGLTLKRVTGTVYADQDGTLNIQESKDGTTYRTTVTQAITASTPYAFDAIFHSRYIRLNYVNGAVAQTVFELVAYSAAE